MTARPLFRPEAVQYRASREDDADILRIDARWPDWTYRIILVAAVVAVAFAALVPVREYASGPAVVRVDGLRVVTAIVPGTVERLLVQPGQHVAADDLLLEMNGDLEQLELARATSEFELQLGRLLRDPTDTVAKTTLSGLKAKRDQAQNACDEKSVRAPNAGTVTDIHVRVGQRVGEGEIILSIAPKDTGVYVLAIVSSDYRPMLARGQPVRFSLDGFEYDYRDLAVDSVSEEGIGPVEAKRYFGPELDDALAITPGAKTLLRARVPDESFTFEGKPYSYFDGLTGSADVEVRNEPILVMLVPALREVWK
jgi:biotin carboxyl carrier protein